MPRISRERWKVYQNVFDEFTLRLIFKLSSQGHFLELKSPLFIGKESNVFTALTHDSNLVVVKIYRLETCDFNKMFDYLKLDPRYDFLKKHRRKTIFAWTQREFRNLLKARDASVPVPKPIAFSGNILIEEFIGDNNPALKIKDDVPKDLKSFSDEIIKNMKKLYKSGLVHGDLSEYNILNYKNNPVFIDFSQATQTDAPNADELLDRDIKNICNFFNKKGLKIDPVAVKNEILK